VAADPKAGYYQPSSPPWITKIARYANAKLLRAPQKPDK